MRVALLAFMLAMASVSQAWAVDLERRVTFEIPAQELSTALLLFAKQADVQVMSSTKEIGTRRGAGVYGELAIGAALSKLLEGTGLHYRAAGDGTILVTASASQVALGSLTATPPSGARAAPGPAGSPLQHDGTRHSVESLEKADHDQLE